MLQFNEIIKRIAETYREDAERLNCDTCAEVFECYGYDTKDLKEELRYSFLRDFTDAEINFIDWVDSFELVTEEPHTVHSYRQIASAIRKYKF